MTRLWLSIRISLEIVGAAAILGWCGMHFMQYMFKDFAGGHCDDTAQVKLTSPDGKHTVKGFDRVCGTGSPPFYFAYLSTGNPNPGYEYVPIIELHGVSLGQTKMTWDGPDKLMVRYGDPTQVVEAYSQILGVRVILNPPLPESKDR